MSGFGESIYNSMDFSLFILDRPTIHDQHSKPALLVFVLASLHRCTLGEEVAFGWSKLVCDLVFLYSFLAGFVTASCFHHADDHANSNSFTLLKINLN